MEREPFAGANKTNRSILAPLERRLAPWVLPRVPRWIETHHLTLLTIVWSAGIIASSALAASDRRWLWVVSLLIFLQWATDHFDGKLGKYRNTGLVKWGYFVDHILDYVFLCAIVIGYALILPPRATLPLLCLLAVFGGFMAHAFLAFSVSRTLTISAVGAGPTEFRVALIVINALVIRFGTDRMVAALPWVAGGGLVALAILVYRTQRRIWRIDMEDKAMAKPGP
jgi:phosphatidylglycerophosphate synthase